MWLMGHLKTQITGTYKIEGADHSKSLMLIITLLNLL